MKTQKHGTKCASLVKGRGAACGGGIHHTAVNRIASLVLSLAMLFTLTAGLDFSVYADIGEPIVSGDYEYVFLDDGTLKINDYYGSDSSLEIPTEIDGHEVSTLARYAFSGCDTIKSIIIPKNIKSIQPTVFWNCSNLEYITVDENNKYYDSRENCNAIIETVTNTMIEACYNTTIPKSVKIIGWGAFGNKKSMETIVVPDNIVKIDRESFASRFNGSTDLKDLFILNRNCDIYNVYYEDGWAGDEFYTIPISVVIHGYKNSTAQEYAKVHGNKFVEIVDPVQEKFKDLDYLYQYNDYVLYTSVYNSFITGTNPPANNVFSPKTAINRAMFVTILYRMAGSPYDNGKNPYGIRTPFADIKNTSAYYYNAACWALDEGVTDQIIFKPNDSVTREQTATMLFRYAQENNMLGDSAYKNVNLSVYHDSAMIRTWAAEPMQWANYNGMITGTEQGYANPQGATQRIHATKILYGFGVVCNIGNFE